MRQENDGMKGITRKVLNDTGDKITLQNYQIVVVKEEKTLL